MQPRVIDPDDTCHDTKNNGKRHVPDWKNVTTESDGGEVYVDVSCRFCGRSGCVGTAKTLAAGITW